MTLGLKWEGTKQKYNHQRLWKVGVERVEGDDRSWKIGVDYAARIHWFEFFPFCRSWLWQPKKYGERKMVQNEAWRSKKLIIQSLGRTQWQNGNQVWNQ